MAVAPAHAGVVAKLSTGEATARRIADRLAESFDSPAAVASAYADAGGCWTVAVHFRDPPNETAVRALVALVADAQAANALVFERIAATDWVKASLAGLAPVAAGRFVVHGAHDRARVPVNRIGIEIEAALAFGTGHHGTTRGCLIALDRVAKEWNGRRRRKTPPRTTFGGIADALHRRDLGRRPKAAYALPFQGREKKIQARRPRNILDVGTGSGVLAIAAARALRAPVLASDIDIRALHAARDNARRNRARGPAPVDADAPCRNCLAAR